MDRVLMLLALWLMTFPSLSRPVPAVIRVGRPLGLKLSDYETKNYVKGSVWPKPQEATPAGMVYTLSPTTFKFSVSGETSDVLEAALTRYRDLTFPDLVNETRRDLDQILELSVDVINEYKPQHLESDESYRLVVMAPTSILTAQTVWGALRGLETFSQIVHQEPGDLYIVRGTKIIDFPRFQHRGFMIDSSRHFLPVPTILKFMDALSYSKFNVLHWHIVDDQSFPYVSESFPELTDMGARNAKTHVYSKDDIAKILEYGRLRGIRVIPEFDTPGHTFSWRGIPDLLTKCYQNNKPNGEMGPINPILASTYEFLERLFQEIGQTFPDRYVHLGGDEVKLNCWLSNPEIKEWMDKMGFKNNVSLLFQFYQTRLLKIVSGLNKQSIVWQEVFDNNVDVFPDTIINVWKGRQWPNEVERVTKKGLKVILSACWYLNYISYARDWNKYYLCEPTRFPGSPLQKELVIGGTGCMWGEWVDATNLLSRTWPRALAVGERLWSSETAKNIAEARNRLWEHRCRYLRRGIPAQSGVESQYCKHEWNKE